MRHLRSLALTSLFVTPLLGQTVWTVPDGTDVALVLAQAAPGDVLQLGTQHPPFVLDKGVLIRGSVSNTLIAVGGGVQLPGPGSITVAVPPGQTAGLERLFVANFNTGYGIVPGTLTLQSGASEVRDVVVQGPIQVNGGSHVLQRLGQPTAESRLVISGGTCSLTDSTVAGRTDSPVPGIFEYSSAIQMTGGVLLASRVTATNGLVFSYFPVGPVPTIQVFGGSAYFTDSTITGSNVGLGVNGPGTPAVTATGGVFVARTSLVPGTGTTATPPSTGYTTESSMVGLYCPTSPTIGAPFTAIVTAGNSQEWLAVVGGFDGTPNTLAPFVEPVFGDIPQLVVLGVTVPAAGAILPLTVAVPNVPSLTGTPVFLQAVQSSGAVVRASALVGGTIR